MNFNNKAFFAIAIILCIFSTACVDSRKAIYFNTQADGTLTSTSSVPSIFIEKNDILNITVSSLNSEASAIFNSPNTITSSNNNTGNFTQTLGYLVDVDGNIQFPILGKVKAAGLTTDDLSRSISKYLTDKKLLVDPIVGVRLLNFKVTVLGEVAKPSVINVTNEKISLLEALGFAGDITIYGKRDNVLIIREEEGKKVIKHLDLNSSELFNSPYYYLQSNDVVYVQPTKARVAGTSRANQLLPIILSGLSFVAIIIDRVTR